MKEALTSEHVTIHYGPAWGKRNHLGSMALCSPGGSPSAMSTHLPFVNCQTCRELLDACEQKMKDCPWKCSLGDSACVCQGAEDNEYNRLWRQTRGR